MWTRLKTYYCILCDSKSGRPFLPLASRTDQDCAVQAFSPDDARSPLCQTYALSLLIFESKKAKSNLNFNTYIKCAFLPFPVVMWFKFERLEQNI